MTMQNSSGSVETEFQVRLPDWVNFSAECESALWMQMEINAKDGEDIISDSAAAGEAAVPITREWNVFLMPGEYNVSVKCDSETSLMLKID